MRNEREVDFDLVIVGMGPVGAVAANLAGQQGLRTLVLDKSLSIYDKPRAMGFDHEIMRILANLGVGEKVSSYLMPYRPSEYRTTDSSVIRRIDAAKPPFLLGWAPNYVFMQPQIEAVLRENVCRFSSVTVELGAEVTAVESSAVGASVTVTLASGDERVYRCAYVLACDGGTSPIRTRLGLKMEDLDFDEPWLVVDVVLKEGCGENLPKTNVQYCEIERPATFVVGPERVRRWEFMINPGETPAEVAHPDSVRQLLSRWLQPDEYELWRASTYRFHALVLGSWRAGRVFFLGDAAHMTPPFLAQGMCQGIRDAANLLWKLALVNRRMATSALLDSYEQERAPHVRQTTLVTKALGALICERDPVAAAQRDELLLREMALHPEGTVRQTLIPGLEAGFLSALPHGPRGMLFPQPVVTATTGEERLLDDVTGAVFRLVIRVERDLNEQLIIQSLRACLSLRGLPIIPVLIGQDLADGEWPVHFYREMNGMLVDWMSNHDCAAIIIRPDHYVFGGCRQLEDASSLVDELAQALRARARSNPAHRVAALTR